MDESKASDIESENEVLDLEHSKLLSAVRQLDGKQRVKAPTRKETSRQISEFNLGKHQIENDTVGVNELTKALEKRASHVEIGQKLKNLKQKAKPLKPPLEKFEAEKIKRVVGFTNVKQQLNRWNAVVDRNRVAENLIYPLIPKGSITLDTTKDFVKRFESQSELEAKVAEILSRSKVVNGDKEVEKEDEEEEGEEFPLSLEEIMERRKEMAKLRAQQSYREAKAARQKKIKSKSYHRTLRRQKIKQQLKDFENLQKTDPEAALKQLEQIERARAEERMTLRHRNTGKWARSRAVRAKYNDQTRQELAEQLAISRDLTKKIQIEESSSDEAVEEDINVNSMSNSDNPWVTGKTESEVENFLRGYKRFWEQKSVREQQENKGESSPEESKSSNKVNSSNENKELVQNENQGMSEGTSSDNINKEINVKHTSVLEEENRNHQDSDNSKEVIVSNEKVKRKKQSPSKTKKKRKFDFDGDDKIANNTIEFISSSGSWQVTPLCASDDVGETKVEVRETEESKNKDSPVISVNGAGSGESVEELFQKMEEKMRASVNKRIAKYQKEFLSNVEGPTANDDNSDGEMPVSLEMKKQVKHPELDEALSEGATQQSSSQEISELQKMTDTISGVQQVNRAKTDIDPKKFIAVKAKPLDSELPDVADMEEALDDEGDESARQLTITEAFADDDVVEQFRKEKEEAVKKSEPEDIDLSLPGWGTWGGKGILASVPKKKKKRFIIKFPKPPPRKDSNKGDVIINEEKDVKIKEHQVSEVPFPFTTVKDYEASVRAPIGATWVTQSSHRKLTAPKYKTYLGKIIKPIDEDLLLKKKPVAKRK
ncbi:U3 small nucleolar RNA-associated protein 14 homolog B [Schistocerca serialis cubense]|uniref:U3 small nucleolar RNA-associated protein 14 homolog B n=1 Tax=Schistocerca serialis cubense TaxID=2023355 RepID=UPI00214ED508|nr:U3 small nucleolar RNA-associated protein 14 homolog B [Schistocerca serialis cubense]